MRKLLLTVIGTLALVGPTDAMAHARAPSLTFAQARAAVMATDRAQHPARIVVGACRRRSRTVIRCRNTMYGLVTSWTFDDQPITMTLVAIDTVHRLLHRTIDRGEVLWFRGY